MRSRNAAVTSGDFKILAVDDDVTIIKAVKSLLKRNGYQFDGVTDPLLALEKVRTGSFDLLLMDYRMGPLRGDELVTEIRKFNQDIYILIYTDQQQPAPLVETMRNLDIQGYFEKNEHLERLLPAIESAIKTITRFREARNYQAGVNRVLEMIPKIYQMDSIENILGEMLQDIVQLVKGKNAFILMDDITPAGSVKNILYKGIGIYNCGLDKLLSMLNPVLMEQIGLTRTSLKPLRLENAVIFPLYNRSTQSIGVIYVGSPVNNTGLHLLEIYINQAASALNNVILHSLANHQPEGLNPFCGELQTRYFDTIEVLRLAVDAKDVYTRGHSDRVAYYAAKIGQAFNLSRGELELLRIGGIFHDIGKIGTPEEILLKTGKLDPREYQEIQKHPVKGANILAAVPMFKEVVPLIRSHHERIDGRGYPDRLKGDQIPFPAKILAVADAFDAMTSNRLYRAKLSVNEAVSQLQNGAGTQFDPEVVARFIQLLTICNDFEQEVAASSSALI